MTHCDMPTVAPGARDAVRGLAVNSQPAIDPHAATLEHTTSEQMTLERWREKYHRWLTGAALPLWAGKGLDQKRGGFHEALTPIGEPADLPRRARVQGRQSFVFALAGRLGWGGPWRQVAGEGLQWLERHHLRDDGLHATLVSPDGAVLDGTAMTYDQSFPLLAAAALQELGLGPGEDHALGLLANLERLRRHGKGFVEADGRFLSNPQMHLFEAALAWVAAGGRAIWTELAHDLADLALNHLIDPDDGVIGEFYDAQWRPARGDDLVTEPGHQFEWSWLLGRWARLSGDRRAHRAAITLFEAGLRGVDPARNVAIDETDPVGRPRRMTARLWPQTERLKAAHLLQREAETCAAAAGLWPYLDHCRIGLWHDTLDVDGNFKKELAPASSLYHVIGAVAALQGHWC